MHLGAARAFFGLFEPSSFFNCLGLCRTCTNAAPLISTQRGNKTSFRSPRSWLPREFSLTCKKSLEAGQGAGGGVCRSGVARRFGGRPPSAPLPSSDAKRGAREARRGEKQHAARA